MSLRNAFEIDTYTATTEEDSRRMTTAALDRPAASPTTAASQDLRSKAHLERLFSASINEDWIKDREGAKKQQYDYVPHERVREFLCETIGLDLSADVQLVNVVTKEGDQYGWACAVVKVTLSFVTADGRIVSRSGLGTKAQKEASVPQALEKAAKAAESDGWKRAAMTLGPAFGLALKDQLAEADSHQSESPKEQRAAAATQQQAASAQLRGAAPNGAGGTISTGGGTRNTAPLNVLEPPADPTRADLESAGWRGAILDVFTKFGPTERVPQETMEKAFEAFRKSPSFANDQGAVLALLAQAGIDVQKPELVTGAHYRRFAWLGSVEGTRRKGGAK